MAATVKIGPFQLANNLALAPMAGVTDRPFRMLCRSLGAGIAASEMVTSDVRLWHTRKSRLRLDHEGEPEPRIVQIAGAEPGMMAEAARENVRRGAQIIDINMGCPAKKVCNKAAGSALLRDLENVKRILTTVVDAVSVPVMLKTRTGWSQSSRNGVEIALLAEQCGVQALAFHGRTREDKFKGEAEYDTIRDVCRATKLPVFVNGDIDTPQKARSVLQFTGAAGVMIGRAAQGRPWIFRDIAHYLQTGHELPDLDASEVRDIMLGHLQNLYRFYGDQAGVRIARKHLGWYCRGHNGAADFRHRVLRVETANEQMELTTEFFDSIAQRGEQAAFYRSRTHNTGQQEKRCAPTKSMRQNNSSLSANHSGI